MLLNMTVLLSVYFVTLHSYAFVLSDNSVSLLFAPALVFQKVLEICQTHEICIEKYIYCRKIDYEVKI